MNEPRALRRKSMAFPMATYGIGSTIYAALTPLPSLLIVLLYFDVRVRKEGYDLELLVQEVAGLPPGSDPSGAPA